jgi:hypothetical protein
MANTDWTTQLPPFLPLAEKQALFLRARVEEVLPLSPHLGKLRDRLLGFGGLEVVLPRYADFEPSMRARDDYYSCELLVRGQQWPGTAAIVDERVASACHQNVATAALAGRGSIVTGYSLSSDGLWREHSWLLDLALAPAHELVETTVLRLLYFGFVLNAEERRRFIRGELGPDALP